MYAAPYTNTGSALYDQGMRRPTTHPTLRALKRAQAQVEAAETRLDTLRDQRNAAAWQARADGISYRRIAAAIDKPIGSVQHYVERAIETVGRPPGRPDAG